MTERQQDGKAAGQKRKADLGRRFGAEPADPARLEALRASLQAESAPAIPEPARPPKPPTAASAMLSARIPPSALRQLKILGAEEGLSMQELVCEALDLLFKARGKAPVAR
jgi:hypothetical protein